MMKALELKRLPRGKDIPLHVEQRWNIVTPSGFQIVGQPFEYGDWWGWGLTDATKEDELADAKSVITES